VPLLADVSEAQPLTSRGKVDLFIVDWIIPDMDGAQLLANLKAIPA